MSNRLTLTLAAALLTAATAAAAGAAAKKYEIAVGDFTALNVAESVAVEYRSSADSTGMATFTTTPDKAALVTFDNNKGTLKIELADDADGVADLPVVTVYSRFLVKVENSGDSLVRVARVEATPSFCVRLVGNGQVSVRNIEANYLDASLRTGSGVIAITGKATKAKYSLVGVGSIQADEMEAVDVKCTMLGPGYVECFATGEISVNGGAGKVYYKGSPKQVKKKLAPNVKLIPLGQPSE